MAVRAPHPSTLFHLVPINQVAHDSLSHPDNERRVSISRTANGLEVGYHVPSIPGGRVITALGRDADLILCESPLECPMSRNHVAFEFNPISRLVCLSVRSKSISSVKFVERKERSDDEATTAETIIGDGIIHYGKKYNITIASYEFCLVWRTISEADNNEALRALAVQGYETSQQRLQDVKLRKRPTEIDNLEAQPYVITALQSTTGPVLRDLESLRVCVGDGTFGSVYKAIERTSGYVFAIKIVNLSKQGNVETARTFLRREIQVMQGLQHRNIIEYLGHQKLHTPWPEIFMPLRSGTLTELAMSPPPNIDYDNTCVMALNQMLCALDYIAYKKMIHRDVKPDNILYSYPNGRYLFQLADFGLANEQSLATTFCGTGQYQAPELWPSVSGITASQSPKLDIWSLFATMFAVRSRFKRFPPHSHDYATVLHTLVNHISCVPKLEAMARLDPDHRASAAQMLVLHFREEDLTTPSKDVPPLARSFPAS